MASRYKSSLFELPVYEKFGSVERMEFYKFKVLVLFYGILFCLQSQETTRILLVKSLKNELVALYLM